MPPKPRGLTAGNPGLINSGSSRPLRGLAMTEARTGNDCDAKNGFSEDEDIGMITRFIATEYNAIGMVGVVLILVAYLLLQIDRLGQDSVLYSLLNAVGACFILVSLYYSWNLASGVIEIAWLIISLFGLGKSIYLKFRK